MKLASAAIAPYPNVAPARPRSMGVPATIVIATGLKLPMRTIRPSKISITYVIEKGSGKFHPAYVFPSVYEQEPEIPVDNPDS